MLNNSCPPVAQTSTTACGFLFCICIPPNLSRTCLGYISKIINNILLTLFSWHFVLTLLMLLRHFIKFIMDLNIRWLCIKLCWFSLNIFFFNTVKDYCYSSKNLSEYNSKNSKTSGHITLMRICVNVLFLFYFILSSGLVTVKNEKQNIDNVHYFIRVKCDLDIF